MAGHNKWSSIKHKKAKVDAQKGKAFTKVVREIVVAARQGGGDPDMNPALRLALQKAKAVNMPKDNVERAVAKGIGGGDDSHYEEVIYEAYGPNGVAILIYALTDNRNRTGPNIRTILDKNGGNLAAPGAVSYLFDPASKMPQFTVELDLAGARQIVSLIALLEEDDDVQDVYSNFSASDEVMAEVMA